MDESEFLIVAKKAALEAGEIIKKYSGNFGVKTIKEGDKSNFATIADVEAEKAIIKILTDNFPTHNIIAEESGIKYKKSKYTWSIDPLDGSLTFAQNIPYYTVSIGLLEDNLPILGAVNHVGFNNLYWAEKGKGTYTNGKKISVSKKNELEESVGTLDFGHRQKRQMKMDMYINKLITKIGYPYEFGSAAVTLALVADGTLDFYVCEAYPWDFVAGAVIVREAGGKVTDFSGNEPDWSKERFPIIASNGLIHDQIINVLRS